MPPSLFLLPVISVILVIQKLNNLDQPQLLGTERPCTALQSDARPSRVELVLKAKNAKTLLKSQGVLNKLIDKVFYLDQPLGLTSSSAGLCDLML